MVLVTATEIKDLIRADVEGEIFFIEVIFPQYHSTASVPDNMLSLKASDDPDTMYFHQAMKEPDETTFQQATKNERTTSSNEK